MTVQVVALWGAGDAYLVAALYKSFVAKHRQQSIIVCKKRVEGIVELFDVPYHVDEELVRIGETDEKMRAHYPNAITHTDPFFVHPSFKRTPARLDHLTIGWDASQADMYRALMQLDPGAPLALPRIPDVGRAPGMVVVVEDAYSWPNSQPWFWHLLIMRLREDGWDVVRNDKRWSLGELLRVCASAEWVIGPQCGVMSTLVTGRFPCRKTIATPSLDGNRNPDYLAAETFPYAYVTKFANEDFDVEEFKITNENHAELVDLISGGSNARRLWAHDPAPVTSIRMSLTPGDFLDRLAVLRVKRWRFPPEKAAAIEREYQRHEEMRRQTPFPDKVWPLYDELFALHLANFDRLERAVPKAMAHEFDEADEHGIAMRSNHDRVMLKLAIDTLCRAPYREVKSYYGGDQRRQEARGGARADSARG